MLDFGSLGLLVKVGQQLTGLGTSAEAKERAQIVQYMTGVADRLNAISSTIRGTSEQNLSQLCASLEGYGRVGA